MSDHRRKQLLKQNQDQKPKQQPPQTNRDYISDRNGAANNTKKRKYDEMSREEQQNEREKQKASQQQAKKFRDNKTKLAQNVPAELLERDRQRDIEEQKAVQKRRQNKQQNADQRQGNVISDHHAQNQSNIRDNSSSTTQIEEIIQNRQDDQLEELLSFAINSEERSFLESWYNDRYLKYEIRSKKLYFQAYDSLKITNTRQLSENELLTESNILFQGLWPLFRQHGLEVLKAKFRREIPIPDKYTLPISALKPDEDKKIFENFIKSRITIEIARNLKFLVVKNLGQNSQQQKELQDFVVNKLLQEDYEEINCKMIQELKRDKNKRKWGDDENQQYLSESVENQWKNQKKELKAFYQSLVIRIPNKQRSQPNPQPTQDEHFMINTQTQPALRNLISNQDLQRMSKNRQMSQEDQFQQELQEVLEKFQIIGKGQKGKRMKIMQQKILEENQLIDEDENGRVFDDTQQKEGSVSEIEDYSDIDLEDEIDDLENRIGPNGEIYASSSSGEEEEFDSQGNIIPKRFFIPRVKIHAYQKGDVQQLRERKRNPMKFTKGTDPRTIELQKFMVDETVVCPHYLPLDMDDAKITANTMNALMHQEHIPISEFIKKENYYKFYNGFTTAIQADPALLKMEIQKKLHYFDDLYGINSEARKDDKFTQGDYRRFCATFMVLTRKLLKQTEFLMAREKRKRMMPRHLLTAAVLTGLVPLSHIPQNEIDKEEMIKLEAQLLKKTVPRMNKERKIQQQQAEQRKARADQAPHNRTGNTANERVRTAENTRRQ
eukprot:403351373